MAIATTQIVSNPVQQLFLWDDSNSGDSLNGRQAKVPVALAAKPAATESLRISEDRSHSDSKIAVRNDNHRTRPPMTVPTLQTTSSARRGRCEHIGGILASVLEKYGIGLEQLQAEIEALNS